MEMIPWKYNGEVFVPPEEFTPEIWYGFVYMIYSLRPEGKKYVGKKFFWKQKTLPITKKRKRRKRLKVESDWRDYWGSNKHLVADVQEYGENMFRGRYYISVRPKENAHIWRQKNNLIEMFSLQKNTIMVLLTVEYAQTQ